VGHGDRQDVATMLDPRASQAALRPRRLKPYPTYKDSGVEWLGEIPAHWITRKLKRVVRFAGGGTPAKDTAAFWSGDIPWVSPKDMKSEVISDTEDHVTDEAVAGSATQIVPPGAVLIVVRSGILKHSIPVAINVRPVALNQDMKALMPKDELRPEYVKYLVAGHQNALLVDWRKAGATVESIEQELLANTACPLPPLPEQRAIAAFLDRETARIDALVAKKERLVELLQEKRTALITRAVTKGLDPNVPMKDSGVEWLGEIPAHWEVRPLAHTLRRITYGFTNPMPVSNDGPFMVTANDIADGKILYDTARRTTEEAYTRSLTDKSRPQRGDILLTKDGTLGRVAVADGTPVCINQSVALLRIDGGLANIEFMQNALRSAAYQDCMVLNAGGTAIKHLYITRLAKMVVAFPPKHEQQKICMFCNERRQEIDALISKVREAIGRLTELRTALISAAVTGKIDVRSTFAEATADHGGAA
jgi:type I restriction enzyme S subunit